MSAHEAENGETLTPGTVYIAPGGSHLELDTRDGRPVTRVVEACEDDKYAPSVDRLFGSCAKHLGSDLLAVVLTGMGDDGSHGVVEVREAGGGVIAEDESTAVIFGMPQQAIRTGSVDLVLPLHEIATAIAWGATSDQRRQREFEHEGTGMSSDTERGARKGEEVLHILKRGADFARELMQENERLRSEMARSESVTRSAAQSPEDWTKLRMELLERIESLEVENRDFRERLFEVEDENRCFADRYVEVEEENNNLANLYVASYQLHSTLDVREVLRIVVEIVINLVGAERFALYAVDGQGADLEVVAAEGAPSESFPSARIGEGPIGRAAVSTDTTCHEQSR